MSMKGSNKKTVSRAPYEGNSVGSTSLPVDSRAGRIASLYIEKKKRAEKFMSAMMYEQPDELDGEAFTSIMEEWSKFLAQASSTSSRASDHSSGTGRVRTISLEMSSLATLVDLESTETSTITTADTFGNTGPPTVAYGIISKKRKLASPSSSSVDEPHSKKMATSAGGTTCERLALKVYEPYIDLTLD